LEEGTSDLNNKKSLEYRLAGSLFVLLAASLLTVTSSDMNLSFKEDAGDTGDVNPDLAFVAVSGKRTENGERCFAF